MTMLASAAAPRAMWASDNLPKNPAQQALGFPLLPMLYWIDSLSFLSLLWWQTLLNHRMLQPAHLMRVLSESASKWLQLQKWDSSGTSTTHPQPLHISLGAVAAPEQRQTCRNTTSAITGAVAGCGVSAARHRVQVELRCGASACWWSGIMSKAQWLRQAVAHWRVCGAASCLRCSGCGRLWNIGVLAARHRVRS